MIYRKQKKCKQCKLCSTVAKITMLQPFTLDSFTCPCTGKPKMTTTVASASADCGVTLERS